MAVALATVIGIASGMLAAPAGAASVAGAKPPRPVIGSGVVSVPRLAVRLAPKATSPVLATLSEFRPEDFSPRPVLAIDVKLNQRGKPAWYRIPIPGRPNGRTGWVRAYGVSIRPVSWQIVVLRGQRIVQLWKREKLVRSARVAVGARGMETPLGLFYVTRTFKPVRQTFLGLFAFETSAYSKLSEWPGGGVVGLHGTWQPHLLGQAVSHGCVRLSNATALFFRSRVPVGTPIRIRR